MALVPFASSDFNRAATDVALTITERTGLQVEVNLVERDADALALLCASSGSDVNIAWVRGITVVAASAQGCGEPLMIVERGQGADARVGERVALITGESVGAASVGDLAESTVCRLGYDDRMTWLVPSLMLQAEGIDPLTERLTLVDYTNLDALIAAVETGECDAAGVPETALDEADAVRVLAESAIIPYSVLVVPPNTPLDVRRALGEALVAMAINDDQARSLRVLVGQDALRPASENDLQPLRAFAERSGLDFAQIGQ